MELHVVVIKLNPFFPIHVAESHGYEELGLKRAVWERFGLGDGPIEVGRSRWSFEI